MNFNLSKTSLNVGMVLYSQILTRSELCDMVILGADGDIYCHSSIVATRSERIRKYLVPGPVQNRAKLIFNLKSVATGPILSILKYIYTGDKTFGPFTLEVLKIAPMFECNELLVAALPQLAQNAFVKKEEEKEEAEVEEIDVVGLGEHKHADNCCKAAFNSKATFNPSTALATFANASHVPLHRVIRLSKPSANEELKRLQTRRDLAKISKDRIKELRRYCFQCDKTFATVGSCTRHFKMIHFKMKPLACYVCGHSFYQKSDLKKHLIRTHKEDIVMTSAKLNFITN